MQESPVLFDLNDIREMRHLKMPSSHTFCPSSCWTNEFPSTLPNHARRRDHHWMRGLLVPDYRASLDRINFQWDVDVRRGWKPMWTPAENHQREQWMGHACLVAFASSLFCRYSLKIAVFPGYPFGIPWRTAVMSTCSFALRGMWKWRKGGIQEPGKASNSAVFLRRSCLVAT